MKFPKHECGLHLTHNQHKDFYEDISDYIQREPECFKDAASIARAIDTNEIWELQWYPTTPVGFFKVAAPTIEEVIALALEVESK
jgi:hypothetical protein